MSLLVGLLWGISPIMQKHLLKKFDNFSLILFFATVYIIIIMIASIYYQKTIMKDFLSINAKDVFIIFCYAFFTSFLSNLLIFHLLKLHDTYIVAAFAGTAPLFTLLIVFFLFNEKITIIGALGVILIVLGVGCIAINDLTFKIEEIIGFR